MSKGSCMAMLLAGALALGGCGTNAPGAGDGSAAGGTEEKKPAEKPAEKPPEPVTLKFHQLGVYFTPEDFKLLLADPVKKKYPHITLEMINYSKDLANLLSTGETVDFLVTYNGQLAPHKDLDVLEDITPLAKKHNFDLSRFDPGAIDALKTASDKGELYALPYAVNLNALYYNKDIFDKFGVAYPKDGMSWDEAIDLGAKLTRREGDVQYRGIEVDNLNRLLFPLSLNVVDANTNKAMADSDAYKKVFEVGKRMFSIPGNEYLAGLNNRFMKDKNVAMAGTVNLFLSLKQTPDLNWDIAQFPSYKERPNLYGMYDLHLLIPMKMSKHKDDVMRVMEVMFSDEVQTTMVRKTARISTLQDPKYVEQYAKDIPELAGKRIESIFKSKPAPAQAFSKHFVKASALLNTEYVEYLNNKIDVNTALRNAEEKINQMIKSENSK
ncbi:extracellular solute-binding protein [Paenibacillus sp. GYB004]|uniref:ABC transporter substrate-binding protein n=1 Tax=Paenibacillus sp. GYB004 TaxID=2994393 RepID=UPI002F96DBA8